MSTLNIALSLESCRLISARFETLVRAIRIIHNDSPSVAELTRKLDVAKGTAHGLVKTLEELGIVQKDPARRRREAKNQRILKLTSNEITLYLPVEMPDDTSHEVVSE